MNWQAIRNLRYEQLGAFLALLIIAFLPNYGIVKVGPSPVVPAFLLCLMGLWLVWHERRTLFSGVAQRRWLVVFVLILLPVLFSIPGSYSPRHSIGIALVLGLYFFTGLALIRALRDAAQRTWLVKWVSIVLVFWVVDALVQYGFGRDLFGIAISSNGRVLGPFAGNLRLPLFLALLLPILLMWLMPRGLAVTLAGFGVLGGVAMLSGARSVLVFLLVVGAGLFVHLPGGRRKWLAALVMAAVAGSAVLLSPVLQERFKRFSALENPTFENMDQLLSGRLTIAQVAGNMVLEHPFSGVGAGGFQAAYSDYSAGEEDRFQRKHKRAYHAHQLYVGLAAETGLIGLAAFLLVVTLLARWYWMAPRERRQRAWPFALSLVAYAFPLNSQPVLFQQWMFPVLLLMLAAMLAALEDRSQDRSAPKQVSSTV